MTSIDPDRPDIKILIAKFKRFSEGGPLSNSQYTHEWSHSLSLDELSDKVGLPISPRSRQYVRKKCSWLRIRMGVKLPLLQHDTTYTEWLREIDTIKRRERYEQ